MTTGPGDEPAAAGREGLRQGHADREQVIEALKDAFVQGRLTRDELGVRAGQALAARTYADLAALTADIPPGPPVARPARRHPLARAAAGSGGCLVIAAAAVRAIDLADPGPTPGVIPKYWGTLFVLIAVLAVFGALLILGNGVNNSLEQRRSRGQLPPRPGPDGHGLHGEQGGGTGHGPIPPGSGDGQARTDQRAHKPPQHIAARAARAPRGVRPPRGAPVPRAT
jgi:Domain of unknown function (DUF1707)